MLALGDFTSREDSFFFFDKAGRTVFVVRNLDAIDKK